MEQLGPWATTAEPSRLEPVLRNKRDHDGERPAHRDEEWPPLAATREGPRTEMKTQHSHKLKKKKKKSLVAVKYASGLSLVPSSNLELITYFLSLGRPSST